MGAVSVGLPSPDVDFFDRRVTPVMEPLMAYHRHSLAGAEHLPRRGPAIILSTHSLATYELFFAFIAIRRQTGRLVRSLADNWWWHTRVMGEIFEKSGLVPASPTAGRALLDAGELLGISPGGQREALRPSTERHRLSWHGRLGFARLAILAQVPLYLAACPAADGIFTVYRSPFTEWSYRRFAWPLPIFRGLGPTLLPRPVKLTTYIAPPFSPPRPAGPEPTPGEVESFRAEVERRMVAFVAEAMERDAR